MQIFTELAKKGKTVIGMTQSINYKTNSSAFKRAQTWMNEISEGLSEEESKKKIIPTWRQVVVKNKKLTGSIHSLG